MMEVAELHRLSTYPYRYLPDGDNPKGTPVIPLDMVQFKYMFNSMRIPCETRDYSQKDETARHVAVIRKGRVHCAFYLGQRERSHGIT